MSNNLTATWLAHRARCGDTRAMALRHLNLATKRRYTHSRLNQWLRGEAAPDRIARVAMLEDVLPDLFLRHGVRLNAGAIDDLAEALT